MKEPKIGTNVFPYGDELLTKMIENDIGGIPACFYFLDIRKTNTWCHDYADLLVYLIEDSNRVKGLVYGKKGFIEHSWVECNGRCYDVTCNAPISWDKGFYYEFAFASIVGFSNLILNKKRLSKAASRLFARFVVAIIRDIEQNIEKTTSPELLKALIELYKEQEYPDENECDEKLIAKHMKRICKFYRRIEKFKYKREMEQKSNNESDLDER